MYATAHLDVVRAAVAERLEGSAQGPGTVRLPAAPARITTWGPRASRRPAPATTSPATELPRPREVDLSISTRVLLDA
jgi:hypothetical protein